MLLRMRATYALGLGGKQIYSWRVPSKPKAKDSSHVTQTHFDYCFMGAASIATGTWRRFCCARRSESVRVFRWPGLQTVHIISRAIYFHATVRRVDGSCRLCRINRRRACANRFADAVRSFPDHLRNAHRDNRRAAIQRIFCSGRHGTGHLVSRHRARVVDNRRWTVVG
jgi:hypothetical protein